MFVLCFSFDSDHALNIFKTDLKTLTPLDFLIFDFLFVVFHITTVM